MATMRDIKRRKSSIESTEQITKAMKLVATVKLQKSRTKAENSRLYFNLMYQTIQEMLKKSTGIRHRYLKSGDSKKKAVIVVSSNRGLAGGYNSNIIRLVTESGIPKEDALIFAIGRKGRDGLARKGYEIKADYSDVIDEPLYSDAQQISAWADEAMHWCVMKGILSGTGADTLSPGMSTTRGQMAVMLMQFCQRNEK